MFTGANCLAASVVWIIAGSPAQRCSLTEGLFGSCRKTLALFIPNDNATIPWSDCSRDSKRYMADIKTWRTSNGVPCIVALECSMRHQLMAIGWWHMLVCRLAFYLLFTNVKFNLTLILINSVILRLSLSLSHYLHHTDCPVTRSKISECSDTYRERRVVSELPWYLQSVYTTRRF